MLPERAVPLLASCALALAGVGAAEQRSPDPRATILFRQDCGNRLERVELTLFENGTVRLREGAPGSERMTLRELGQGEVEAIRSQLWGVDWEQVGVESASPDSEWSVRCRLQVLAPDLALRSVDYLPLDTASLELERLRQLAARLLEESRERARASRIPSSYEPRIGDRLERTDGVLFEIDGETSDGGAYELTGVEQPYTIYVPKAEIRETFVRVVSRAEAP